MKKSIIILIIFFIGYGSAKAQWVNVHSFTNFGVVQDFADNGSILYSAVNGEGVFKSTNSGANWTLINSRLSAINLNAIIAKDSFVFVGSDSGLFRSYDYGNNWVCVKSVTIYSLTILSKNNTDYLIAGGFYPYRTTNYGNNWTTITSGLPRYPNVRALNNTNEFLYAGITTTSSNDSTGIYKSTNYGDNWIFISQGYNNYPLSIYSNLNLILSGGTSVVISTNYGNNWRVIPGMENVAWLFGITSLGIKDIFVSSWNDGCWVSNDTGTTWH